MRLGSAQADISPGKHLSLLGYDFRQQHLPPGNAGIRDPLLLRVLALDDEAGDGLALIVSLDLCILSLTQARRLRNFLAEDLGISPDRILLACSHTHSGPWLDDWELDQALPAIMPHSSQDAAASYRAGYQQALRDSLRSTAQRAAGLLYPVDCFYREVPLGLGYERRVQRPDAGVALCWNPHESPQYALRSPADNCLSVLCFRQRGANRVWALWSHGAHPVVLGKTSQRVSADWPGAANAALAAEGIEGHFLLGACGDVHPWLATQEGDAAVDSVGRAAAAMVALCAASGGSLSTEQGLRIRSQSLQIDTCSLDITSWKIGDLHLIGIPCELFSGLALELRNRLQAPLILATNTNGWTGYWPDQQSFAAGGYEIDAARAMGRQADSGEQLIEALIQLTHRS